MTAATAPMRPVGEGERTLLLDVLRGFALLGVLLVNFYARPGLTMPRLDGYASSFLLHAVDSSFYPLLSFLFGVGFGVQLLRARERGKGVALLYMRRMLVLFLIGTVHSVLIFERDILSTYAVIGLLLVPLGRLSDRKLLALIVVLVLMTIGQAPVRDTLRSWRSVAPQLEVLHSELRSEVLYIERNRRLSDDGELTYAAITAERWIRYSERIYNRRWLEWLLLSDYLLLFLIGMYAARRRVFETAAARRRGFLVLGAASALAIALFHGYTAMGLDWGEWGRDLRWEAFTKGRTFLYIAVITLLFTSFRGAARALSVFAAPGRMALTTYLTQTVVITLLFVPYGFGLTPLSTAAQLLFSLPFFFLFQVPVSHWWLGRYQYGPAEWVWRSATYGAAQPMRRRPASVAEAVVEEAAPRKPSVG